MDRWIVFALGMFGGLWQRPPFLVVLLLNLIPVACVWWLDWSVLTLLVLYWIENVIVGVFNALKLKVIEHHRPQGGPFALSGFFALHYGMFTLVHGVFTFLIGGLVENPDPEGTFARFWDERDSLFAATATLAALYGVGFIRWVQVGAWRDTTADQQMMAPYGRILVLHLTVLGGAYVMAATKAPESMILLLAVLKTVFDTGWAWFAQKNAGQIKLQAGTR